MSRHGKTDGTKPEVSQTDLFPMRSSATSGTSGTPAVPAEPSAAMKKTVTENSAARAEAVQSLLSLCAPVHAGSKAAGWLKTRRIFRKTWESQGLRRVENYAHATEELQARFPTAKLTEWGLFNAEGHLRFYRHSLLIPWFDGGLPVYLQARAPDALVTPSELSLSGPAPCPYNARLLNGQPGRLYLCDGPLDTMAVLEAGFPAIGVPEGRGLRSVWLSRFREKSVYLAYAADAAGEAAAAKSLALLTARGIEAHRLNIPAGKGVGDWLAGR